MAITLNRYQALEFNPRTKCVCNSPYCQPFEFTDSLMVEGTISPMNGESIMLDGPFNTPATGPTVNDYWSLDQNWQIVGQQLVATNPLATTQAAYQKPLGLQANHIYAITATVTVIGSQTAGLGFAFRVNNEYLIYKDPVNTGKYLSSGDGYSAELQATWIYIPNAITTDDLVIRRVGDSGSFGFQVTALTITEISIPGIASANANGNILTDLGYQASTRLSIDGLSIDPTNTVFVNPRQSLSNFNSKNRIFEDVSTDELNWFFRIILDNLNDFDAGCQYIRVYDTLLSSNLIKNGAFINEFDYWTAGAGWTWSSGTANFDSGIIPPLENGVLTQTVYFPYGGNYQFGFNISGLSIGESVKVSYDIGQGDVLLGTFGNGNQLFDIDTDNFDPDIINLIAFSFQKNSLLATFSLDNVIFVSVHPDAFNESNCISIAESQACTLLFAGDNDDNAFAADVEALGYSPDYANIERSIRLYSKIKYSGYPTDREVFKFSDNTRRIMFASIEKEYEVNIGDAPEHAHDLLTIIADSDTFTIDGVEYVISGDYQLRARQRSDNSQALFLVRDKQGISSNYSCS